MEKSFRYIYGPVESWRMGKSLGIDPLSDHSKICNLDCIYCQLGRSHHTVSERKVYVPTEVIIDEINFLPPLTDIDYYTFSGRGEPTLASNLGEMIRAIKDIKDADVAVITNSTLLYLPEVQRDLHCADLVIAKLDACDELTFLQVDKAMQGTSFENTFEGLKDFKKNFHGQLAIQVMFIEENRPHAQRIAELVRTINADEIQINTPLRPSGAKALDPEGMKEIKKYFSGMPAVTVYERERKETVPFDEKETVKRHGRY